MKRPTIVDGQPHWPPNGARERYLRRMLEEIPVNVSATVAEILSDRKIRNGEVGTDDMIETTKEEIDNFIQWQDLRQLKLIRKLAEKVEFEGVEPHGVKHAA